MILVIGANSGIGSALINYWQNKSIIIEGTTHSEEDSNYTRLDLSLAEHFVPKNPFYSAVIILAGITNIDFCENNKDLAYNINVLGIKTIVEKLRLNTNYFLFLSTNLVFDGRKKNYSKNDKTNPTTVYGKNKVEIEEFLLKLGNAGILRLEKVIDTKKPLFKNWIEALKRSELIEAYENVEISPLAMIDVVRKIDMMVYSKTLGIEHLSGNKVMSYYKLACSMAKKLGVSKHLVNPIKSPKHKTNFIKLI